MFDYSYIDCIKEEFWDGIITKSKDGDTKIVLPSKTSHQFVIDGKDYSVNLDIASSISRFIKQAKGDAARESLYTPFFSVLDVEPFEVRASYLSDPLDLLVKRQLKKPDKRLCAYGDYDYNLDKLTVNQAKTRIAVFLKICKLCERKEIAEKILHEVGFEKNKKLVQKDFVPIATLMACHSTFISDPINVCSLIAVSDGDSCVNITIKTHNLFSNSDQSIPDLFMNNPDLFGITLDSSKYQIRYSDAPKINITYENKTLSVPIPKDMQTISDEMDIEAFSDLLIQKEDGLHLTFPDISSTIAHPIGNHTMTIRFDASDFNEYVSKSWNRLIGVSLYFAGTISLEEAAEMSGFKNYFLFREMFTDEMIILYSVILLLKEIRSFISGENRDLIKWTENAPLKKNGTFNRTRTQWYKKDGTPDISAGHYHCYCESDTQYLIATEMYGLGILDTTSASEELKRIQIQRTSALTKLQ